MDLRQRYGQRDRNPPRAPSPRRTGLLAAGLLAWTCLGWASLGWTGAGAHAQDDEAPPPPPPPPVDDVERGPDPEYKRISPLDPAFRGALLGDFVQRDTGAEQVVAAVGGVGQPIWLRQDGIELRCDSIVIWGHPTELTGALRARKAKDPEPDVGAPGSAPGTAPKGDTKGDPKTAPEPELLGGVIFAIYAEGNVFMKRDGQTVRAERLLIDFKRDQAYMVRATVSGRSGVDTDQNQIPFTFRAEVVRAVAHEKYRAENARFTTSDRFRPAYQFRTDWIEVDFNEEYIWFETATWPVLEADTVFGQDTPLLVLPKLGGRTFDLRPIQDIAIGNSSRKGTFIEVEWGGDFKDEENVVWGEWKLHTDYRNARGAGLGLDFVWVAPDRPGPDDEFEFESYFQRDTADLDDYSERPFDGLVTDDNDHNRSRFHAWFRHHFQRNSLGGLLDEGWRLDAELSAYSDRGFLPEYYKEEALTKKQQETYVQLRRTWGNEGLSALASYRLNDEAIALLRRPSDLRNTDYQVQTQYLPSVTYHMIEQPLLRQPIGGWLPVNLSVQASAANVERRYDDRVASLLKQSTGYDTDNVLRGDLETRITTPFELGPVHVVPAFGGSVMAVDDARGPANNNLRGRDRGSEERYAGFWSLRAGSEAHRNFDVDSSFLDLDGLRHVVSADGRYLDRFEVSEDSREFQFNDQIEQLEEVRVGIARLRNRLQTQRDGETVDWLDYETSFIHYFDRQQRSGIRPFGVREDFAQPLQRLDFPGEEKFRNTTRDGSSFVQHRLRVEATSSVWLVGEGDYDIERKEWETTLAGVRWLATDRMSLYTGRRTIANDSRIWTARVDYKLSNKWGIALQQQHNFRSDRSMDTRLTLYRRAYDYTIAIEFENDRQNDETTLSFAIYPNFWLSGSRDDPFHTTSRKLDYDALRWYR